MDLQGLGRVAAVAMLAAAIIGTVVATQTGGEETEPEPAPSDALSRELARCDRLGLDAIDDAACQALWDALRERFLGSQETSPASDERPAALPNDAGR